MNLYWVIEEYTDVQSAAGVQDMVDVITDALYNPHNPRPEGEIILGKIAKE